MGDGPARTEKPKETGTPVLTRFEEKPATIGDTPAAYKPAPEKVATEPDSSFRHNAIVDMERLDDRVRPGSPMLAGVERDYRSLIDSFEPKDREQTAGEKDMAIAARTRMMGYFDASGETNKLGDMAEATIKKYPEALLSNEFLKHSVEFKDNPRFKELLDNVDPKYRDRFEAATPLNKAEQAEVKGAIDKMQGFDMKMLDDRSAGYKDYWNLIEGHEPGGTRVDRKIASAARMRVISHMNDDRDSPSTMLATMKDSMEKHPGLTKISMFMGIAADQGALNDPAWMASFVKAGGNEKLLQGYKPDK